MKFKHKPIQVEAVQYNGKNLRAVRDVIFSCDIKKPKIEEKFGDLLLTFCLHSSSDKFGMMIKNGDWVIKGLNNMISILDDNAFNSQYEAAE